MRLSIAKRLFLLFAVIIGGTLIIIDVIMIRRETMLLLEHRRNELAGNTAIIATLVARDMANADRLGANQKLTAIGAIPDISFIELIGHDGRLFTSMGDITFRTSRILPLNQDDRPPFLNTLAADQFVFERTVRHRGENIGLLRAYSNVANLKRQILLLVSNALLSSALVMFGSLLVVSILQKTVTRPIIRLTNFMDAITNREDYHRTVNIKSNDEIGHLATAFNTLLGRIRDRDRELQDHRDDLEKTVEQRTEQYQIAKEEAEQANRAKSDFLAVVSHEIRTPLNGMLVMAEILTRSDLADAQKRHANIIFNSGQNLLTVINDILDLSKIEAGKLSIETTSFCLKSLIEETVNLFTPRAGESGLKLTFSIASGLPDLVEGDPNRTRQILSNLVGNALKFTHEGGVQISCRFIAAPTPDTSPVIHISVRDTGIGISADKHEHIFEPFSQADQSTSRQFGGTGLGLSICKQLVENMNGRIGMSSEPGCGSTFWFAIPTKIAVETALPAETGRAIAAPQAASKADRQETPIVDVLVADDNPINQEVVREALAGLAVSLTMVGDGEEAIQKAKTGRYRIILMDGSMPILDGIAATRAIRAWEAGARPGDMAQIAIIALTANTAADTKEDWLVAGADDYLEKPFTLTKIQETIRYYLADMQQVA